MVSTGLLLGNLQFTRRLHIYSFRVESEGANRMFLVLWEETEKDNYGCCQSHPVIVSAIFDTKLFRIEIPHFVKSEKSRVSLW